MNDITASEIGSFAHGDSTTAAITASATNAVQFGPGTNNLANSLKVGGGIRILGTVGASGAPVNGEIWVESGVVKIRSNGVTVSL